MTTMLLHYSEYYSFNGPTVRIYHEKCCPANDTLFMYIRNKYMDVHSFPIVVKLDKELDKQEFPSYIWKKSDAEDALVTIFKEYEQCKTKDNIQYSCKVDGKLPFIYTPPEEENDNDDYGENEDEDEDNSMNTSNVL